MGITLSLLQMPSQFYWHLTSVCATSAHSNTLALLPPVVHEGTLDCLGGQQRSHSHTHLKHQSTCLAGRPAYPGGSSSSSSSSTTGLGPQRQPDASQLPPARPGEFRECYYSTGEQSSCSVLARNTTQQECCCTVGQGWGMGCQYDPCPPLGTGRDE
jgi:hypothetical protein